MDASGDADLLVCGSCQRNFPLGNIVNFVQHKKFDCSEQEVYRSGNFETLSCQSCPLQFGTPWSLLKHAQNVHALKIYLERGPLTQIQSNIESFETSIIESASKVGGCIQRKAVNEYRLLDGSTLQFDENLDSSMMNSPVVESTGVIDPNLETASNDSLAIKENSSVVVESERGNPLQLVADTEDGGRSIAFVDKCCTAVVPKKRKRHMETKHGGSGGATARRRSVSVQNAPTSIYIDLEPGTEGQLFKASLSRGEDDQNKPPEWTSTVANSVRRHSVIIQPGTTFSIPVSCSSSASMSSVPLSSLICLPGSSQSEQVGVVYGDGRESLKFSGVELSVDNSGFQSEDGAWSHRRAAGHDVSTGAVGTGEETQGFEDGQIYDPDGNGHQQKRRRYPTSRPFKCDQCNDSFNQRVHLKKHQSKHTGVKPFKCDQCDYSTVERSHLRVHIRVHTGEKPYKCTYCKYATAQNSTLKIHLKRHHLDSASGAAATSSASVGAVQSTSSTASADGESSFDRQDVTDRTPNPHTASAGAAAPPGVGIVSDRSPKRQTNRKLSGCVEEHHSYAVTSNHGGGGGGKSTSAIGFVNSDSNSSPARETVDKPLPSQDNKDVQR